MAAYKHGEMDIRDHEKTFHGFVWLVSRGVIVTLCVLIFLAIFNS